MLDRLSWLACSDCPWYLPPGTACANECPECGRRGLTIMTGTGEEYGDWLIHRAAAAGRERVVSQIGPERERVLREALIEKLTETFGGRRLAPENPTGDPNVVTPEDVRQLLRWPDDLDVQRDPEDPSRVIVRLPPANALVIPPVPRS